MNGVVPVKLQLQENEKNGKNEINGFCGDCVLGGGGIRRVNGGA
jgi:hypothetical protein